jgi:hypothetical protein
MDARANVSPCCWLGSRQKDFVTDFDEVKRSWTTESPNPVCVANCAQTRGKTVFEDQWQQEICLV